MNFVLYVVSFWLLAFAVKIGIVLFFSLTGMTDLDLAYSLRDVRLPSAKVVEHISNKRLCMYVTVEKDGEYRIGEYYYDLDQLQKHLTNVCRSLPNVILCIVADKECRMENINTLLTISRKSGILRVSFFCKKIKNESAYVYF